jgi:hypothetical protein
MMNLTNKKSTPEGAPLKQLNGTTFEEKSEAEILFDKIGTGAAYAVRRPRDPKVDREFRRLIAEANASGEDCIINAGYGYYRPGEDDDFEAEIYFASERSRAKEILRKVRRMEEVYDRRYQ